MRQAQTAKSRRIAPIIVQAATRAGLTPDEFVAAVEAGEEVRGRLTTFDATALRANPALAALPRMTARLDGDGVEADIWLNRTDRAIVRGDETTLVIRGGHPPETVAIGLPGRPINAVVSHPLVDPLDGPVVHVGERGRELRIRFASPALPPHEH